MFSCIRLRILNSCAILSFSFLHSNAISSRARYSPPTSYIQKPIGCCCSVLSYLEAVFVHPATSILNWTTHTADVHVGLIDSAVDDLPGLRACPAPQVLSVLGDSASLHLPLHIVVNLSLHVVVTTSNLLLWVLHGGCGTLDSLDWRLRPSHSLLDFLLRFRLLLWLLRPHADI